MTISYHVDQPFLFPTDTKICSLCGIGKSLDNFPRSNTKDGYDPRCKQCRKGYHAEYRAKHRPEPKRLPPISNPTAKVCSGCGKEKPLDAFYNMKQGKFGKQPRCKDCCAPKDRKIKRFPAPKTGYKFCHGCDEEKPLEEFHLYKGGYFGRCIECELTQRREQWPLHHPRKTPIIPNVMKEGYKVCNTCLEEKPFKAFKRDIHKPLGYAGRCKQCEKDRRNALSEEEKIQERLRDRVSREPRREQRQAYDRKRHQTPKRRLFHREASHRRNASKKGATVEKADYASILERDGLFCYICYGKPIEPKDLCFDHVVPLQPRKGEPKGTHSMNNIKPAHKLCNSRKLNKRLEDLTPYDRRGMA